MNNPREHVALDELNDFVDGLVDGAAADVIREHIMTCESCGSEHQRLIALLANAAGLARSVQPVDDLWPALRAQLESRKSIVLPVAKTSTVGVPAPSRPASRGWRSTPMLAAAAVVLVIASSAITALVLRDRQDAGGQTRGAPQQPNSQLRDPVVLQARFQRTEMQYNRTIDELQVAVDAKRSRLSPETVQTVEHSLAVIDSAIVEARSALMADPNSQVLVDLLSANYQRKLDLLRRASELGSKI
jgi:hypothetical protein